jgi:hypothetical protein
VVFQKPEDSSKVCIWHRETLTSVYGDTYGTDVLPIGTTSDDSAAGEDGLCLSGVIARLDTVGLRDTEKSAARFYLSPGHVCVQCGSMSAYENDTDETWKTWREKTWRDDEVTTMEWANLLAWLRRNGKKHAMTAYRCRWCRKQYKRLHDHILNTAATADEYKRSEAVAFLRAIGKYTRQISDPTKRQSAKKAIHRRLRRHFKRLSRGELVFFQMFAGMKAIHSIGGKHGDQRRNSGEKQNSGVCKMRNGGNGRLVACG